MPPGQEGPAEGSREVTELLRLRGSLCFGVFKSNLSMLESHCLEKKLALERPKGAAGQEQE